MLTCSSLAENSFPVCCTLILEAVAGIHHIEQHSHLFKPSKTKYHPLQVILHNFQLQQDVVQFAWRCFKHHMNYYCSQDPQHGCEFCGVPPHTPANRPFPAILVINQSY